MGRVISYGEKTGYNDGDYLLLDNGDGGTKRIRADRVGAQIDSSLSNPAMAAPANVVGSSVNASEQYVSSDKCIVKRGFAGNRSVESLVVTTDFEYVYIDGTASTSNSNVFLLDVNRDIVSYCAGFHQKFFDEYNPAHIKNIVSGHTYKLNFELISGTITKGGVTYTSVDSFGSTNVVRAFLIKSDATKAGYDSGDYFLMRTAPGSVSKVLTVNSIGALALYIYSGVTLNGAKIRVNLVDETLYNEKYVEQFNNSSLKDEFLNDVNKEILREHRIINVDWKYFSRWDYLTGWRQGYYATSNGAYTNNGGYMCSVKEIDLTGIDKIIATPPEGYALAFTFFKSDGSFVAAGSANTSSHPEYINYTWTIDTQEYVKCGITVGRFPNTTGQKGEDYAANETFVESITMTVYYKSRNKIHDYYISEMEQTIGTVRSCLTEPALVFPVITDIHYLSQSGSFNHGVENIKEFCKRVKADFVLNLGDNTDGNIAPAYTILRNLFMLDRFTEIDAPYYQAIGNHDVGGYKDTVKLTPAEIYKSYLSNTHGVVFDMTAGETNYYKDFNELGIRLVVLDIDHNAGWTYSDRTATWLTNTALNTSNIVVLGEHMSSIPTQNWNSASVVNGPAVTAALQTFVNGGGKLIQLCGHSHADYYFLNPWLTIFTTCQKFEKADVTDPNYSEDIQGTAGDIVAPDRTEFTASEDAWTVFIIKPISRTVDAIRFGAGSDMHYTF